MTAARYDLVVIGGGIHGAGVAQAAAAQGHSVLVLEQSALAAGTSSRSSKLIHGGLRYLETGQFSLVKECLQERATLLDIAPELVTLKPFYIPVYKTSRHGPWRLRAGLSLYRLLGDRNEHARSSAVPRSRWGELDGLDTRNLRAVFQYWDAQTDDQALTEAVMNSALDMGATLSMPATFLHASLGEGNVSIEYHYEGRVHQCGALVLVNAAGPWANRILAQTNPVLPQIQTELVQGTHILLDGTLSKGIYYLESPSDARPVFVMPWKNQIMVGTTETVYDGDPGDVKPLVAEKTYLLEVLSYYFPHFRSEQTARITSAFAGLRVLPSSGSSLGARSRDTIIDVDDPKLPRVLTIYGGKLTAYRLTAKKVMQQLAIRLPQRPPKANTATLPLKPGPLRHSPSTGT